MAGKPRKGTGSKSHELIPTGPLIHGGPEPVRKWIGDWLPSLPATPDEKAVAVGNELLVVAQNDYEETRRKDDPEFTVREPLLPALHHLLWAIGMLVQGISYRVVEETTGVSYSRLRVCAAIDKQGFGKVFSTMLRLREDARLARAEDLLAERVETGTKRPVVVRRGRDNDEIEMVPVHSDTLLVKAVEAGVVRSAGREEKNSQTNIGQQIVYHVEAPQFILENQPLNLIHPAPLEGPKKSLE